MREDASKVISEVFDPPFTTIQCGKISGGSADNVVAAECSFTTDVRTIEGQDPRDYEAQFKKHVAEKVLPILKVRRAEADISIKHLSFAPGLDPEENSKAMNILRPITGATGIQSAAYSTEAGVFQKCGLDAVVCGPGNIAQAHQADEFIEINELKREIEIIERVIELQSED